LETHKKLNNLTGMFSFLYIFSGYFIKTCWLTDDLYTRFCNSGHIFFRNKNLGGLKFRYCFKDAFDLSDIQPVLLFIWPKFSPLIIGIHPNDICF
jgi:hypothetical protein